MSSHALITECSAIDSPLFHHATLNFPDAISFCALESHFANSTACCSFRASRTSAGVESRTHHRRERLDPHGAGTVAE